MVQQNHLDLAPLIGFAVAMRHLGNATMANSHASFEMAYDEALKFFRTLTSLGYLLTNQLSPEAIDPTQFSQYLEDLKMGFSEIEFFDLYRELAQYLSLNQNRGRPIESQLAAWEKLLGILKSRVGETTGFQVEYYRKRS
jgi:hypothetical protein